MFNAVKNLTIVVSHPKEHLYLHHCLDILKQLGFNKKNIWVDGYQSYCKEIVGQVEKVTTHQESHGARCFDILSEAKTEFVIIMDSDFFCLDKNFWGEALEQVKFFPFVSIERSWVLGLTILTTPFVAYNREKALNLVPIREAWNHFSHVFPKIPDPVFDHLAFVFFTAMRLKMVFKIDSWEGNRKYQFCHLWDSRHSYEDNFKDYQNMEISQSLREQYLSYGISKYFFHHIAGRIPIINNKIWDYIKNIEHNKRCFKEVQDNIENIGYHISFKPTWVERHEDIRQKFRTLI